MCNSEDGHWLLYELVAWPVPESFHSSRVLWVLASALAHMGYEVLLRGCRSRLLVPT